MSTTAAGAAVTKTSRQNAPVVIEAFRMTREPRGVKGELYPCKPDIFAATYEAVPEFYERTTT